MKPVLTVTEIVSSPREFPNLVAVRLVGTVEGQDMLFGETTSRDVEASRKISRISFLAYMAERWGILDMVAKECTRRLQHG